MRLTDKSMRKGFTLIEIMAVVLIIGLLATLVVPRIMGVTDDAKTKAAKMDIKNISSALQMYRLQNGIYPTTEQGLRALIEKPTTDPVPGSWNPGGYLSSDTVPKDPWNKEYIYRCPGENKDFDVISFGADLKEGGTGFNADIHN